MTGHGSEHRNDLAQEDRLFRLEPEIRTLSKRDLMAYAAGVLSSDEAYFDDTGTEGVIAQPGFLACLDWQLINGDSYRRLTSHLRSPSSVAVHASQAYRYFQPLRPEMCVEMEGRICAAGVGRSGVSVTTQMAFRDRAKQSLLAKSAYTETFLGADALGILDRLPGIDRKTVAQPADKTAYASDEFAMPAWLPHVYTACSGIHTPFHVERSVARAAGFRDIVVHGSTTFAMAMNLLVRRYAGNDSRRLRAIDVRFTGNVIPPEILILRSRDIAGTGMVEFHVEGADGNVVLGGGHAQFNAIG